MPGSVGQLGETPAWFPDGRAAPLAVRGVSEVIRQHLCDGLNIRCSAPSERPLLAALVGLLSQILQSWDFLLSLQFPKHSTVNEG